MVVAWSVCGASGTFCQQAEENSMTPLLLNCSPHVLMTANNNVSCPVKTRVIGNKYDDFLRFRFTLPRLNNIMITTILTVRIMLWQFYPC